METSKKQSNARPKHQPRQSDATQPVARPSGGTHSPHPETVKPDEPGTGPTKKADRSQRDARTKDDKDGNEQQ